MVDSLEDGPLKKMVLALRDQAMGQLKDVKGAEKVRCLFDFVFVFRISLLLVIPTLPLLICSSRNHPH